MKSSQECGVKPLKEDIVIKQKEAYITDPANLTSDGFVDRGEDSSEFFESLDFSPENSEIAKIMHSYLLASPMPQPCEVIAITDQTCMMWKFRDWICMGYVAEPGQGTVPLFHCFSPVSTNYYTYSLSGTIRIVHPTKHLDNLDNHLIVVDILEKYFKCILETLWVQNVHLSFGYIVITYVPSNHEVEVPECIETLVRTR